MAEHTTQQILDSIGAMTFSRTFPARFESRCPLTGMRVWPGAPMRRLECGAYVPNDTIAIIDPFRRGDIKDGFTYDVQAFDADAAAAHLAAGGTVFAIGPNGLTTWTRAATAKQLASRGRKMRLMHLGDKPSRYGYR